MRDRIRNGANLLERHVFQFDFLNDDFSKLPDSLRKIVQDPIKRKKLIIYINPPYAEATTARTVTQTGANKPGVSKGQKIYQTYRPKIGSAANELSALFMAKVYDQLRSVIFAEFSKLKAVQGSNFAKFREFFLGKFLDGFICPANTFDNVNGHFPIGFKIWDTGVEETIDKISCGIFNAKGKQVGIKTFSGTLPERINKWIKEFDLKGGNGVVGFMSNPAPDFQHNGQLYIAMKKGIEHFNFWSFTAENFIAGAVYFSVRQVIKPTWLNDRDQFLYPNENWLSDSKFQNDCLTFTLFHGKNRVTSQIGTNHWIPFKEAEVDAKDIFESHFMTDFMAGRLRKNNNGGLLTKGVPIPTIPLEFSPQAQAVFAAGRKIWSYYHHQPNANVNASLYDIKEHFSGTACEWQNEKPQ